MCHLRIGETLTILFRKCFRVTCKLRKLRNEKYGRQREWRQNGTRLFLLDADLRLLLASGALPSFGPGAADFFGWVTNDEVNGQELLIGLYRNAGDVADAQAQLIQGRGVLGDSLEAGQEDVGADAIGQACTELIEVKLLISGASSRVRLSIELPYKICVMRENFPDADFRR